MSTRIQTGATEPIEVYAVSAAGVPLTGLTDLYVRIRRASDGFFLDWTGMTFKNSGWTTLSQVLTQLSATNAPGLYGVTGGLNTGSITNPTANDTYTVYPLQTPGVNARLGAPSQIEVGAWADRLDANVSTRATQAQILSDATPFPGARIDAAISTRATQAQILSDATPFPGARIDAAISSRAVPGDVQAGLTAQGYTAARAPNLDALDANVSTRATQAQILSDATPFAGANIALIQAKTTNLPTDPADESNQLAQHTATQAAIAALNNLSQAGVQSAMTAQGYTAARAPNLDNLDAAVSTRATQAQILSDATPFAGADVALIKTAAQAVDARLPADPADESVQLTAHGVTQAAVAALNDVSPAQVSAAVWDAARASHVAAGSFGESTRLNAAGLQTDAATEIRDAILDDGTRFSGADIARLDVNVSTRAAPGDQMDLVTGALDAAALDATAVAEMVTGVWDEPVAAHVGAGSTGLAQGRLDVAVSTRAAPGAAMDLVNDAVDSASLATTAAVEIAGKVWDEPLAGHAGAGTAGEAQARLDAAVSSRAAPGAQMALTPAAVAGVVDNAWDEPLAGHLLTGSTGKALQDAGAVTSPTIIAAAVWNESAVAHTAPGSMGQLENRIDTPVSTRAAPGDPMDLQASAVDATVLDISAANKIRDTILSDSTPFLGARIDAAISSRAAPGAAMALVTDAVNAAAVAASGAQELADAVWDEPIAGHLTAGTTGKTLSDGSNPGAIADAVWDEALAGHVGAGSAGEAQGRLDAAVTTRAAPGAAMALVANAVDSSTVATSGANKVRDAILSDSTPFPGARIDAAVTTRAAPGDAMALTANAVTATAVAASGASKVAVAVLDTGLAGHTGPGTAGGALDHLDVDVSTRAEPGDTMAVDPAGVAAVVAGVWNEAIAGHLTPGTTGKALNDAGITADIPAIVNGVWNEPRAGHVTPGTMGEAQEASSTVATQVAKIDSEPTVAPSAAVPGSLLDRLCNKDASRTFNQATDSLEGIRDRIG